MTALDTESTAPHHRNHELTGIICGAIAVSDLQRSATWYRDLLVLDYVREFGNDRRVTGCALADFEAHFMLALRLRDDTAGQADLRGEHPWILEAVDAAATDRVRQRADRLGVPYTAGAHADGTWTEFVDPDGIVLRVVHGAEGPREFMGVHFADDGTTEFYAEPRLALPPRR